MNQKPIVREENSVLRVSTTDISLDSVVIAFQDGLAPEAIQMQYPALTLRDVYGAISHYLNNQQAVDDYLTQQSQRWAELRRTSEQEPNPVVARLRAMKLSAVGEPA